MTYWIVGVSGGPDSMALLDRLRLKGRSLVVVHVNYQQRETALRDQLIVEKYCNQYSIPCVVYDGSQLGKGNFQDLARRFRYQVFSEVYEAYQATRLVLGHHLDDQYETILFQLLSQRKPNELGMKRFTRVQGMRVYRPLLETSKEELIDYCNRNQLEYGVDESNVSLKYTRNRIRLALEDLTVQQKQLLLDYRKHYGKVRKLQNQQVEQFLKKYPEKIALKEYLLLESSIRPLVLRRFFEKQKVDTHEITFRFFKDLDDKLSHNQQFDQKLEDNLLIRVEYGYIFLVDSKVEPYAFVLSKVAYFKTEHFKVQSSGPASCALTLTEADFPIIIRSPKPDDEILMRFGRKKVNRFFIDRKIGKQQRQAWPVVENALKEVIFVAYLGCDINHYSTKPSLYVVK